MYQPFLPGNGLCTHLWYRGVIWCKLLFDGTFGNSVCCSVVPDITHCCFVKSSSSIRNMKPGDFFKDMAGTPFKWEWWGKIFFQIGSFRQGKNKKSVKPPTSGRCSYYQTQIWVGLFYLEEKNTQSTDGKKRWFSLVVWGPPNTKTPQESNPPGPKPERKRKKDVCRCQRSQKKLRFRFFGWRFEPFQPSGGVLKIVVPLKWMVKINGKTLWTNGWFGGKPTISGSMKVPKVSGFKKIHETFEASPCGGMNHNPPTVTVDGHQKSQGYPTTWDECIPNPVNNGITYHSLNWWMPDFWTMVATDSTVTSQGASTDSLARRDAFLNPSTGSEKWVTDHLV